MPILWKPAYKIGNPVIDAEHEALFGLANKFLTAEMRGELSTCAMAFYRYTREHFAHEETLMREIGYPARPPMPRNTPRCSASSIMLASPLLTTPSTSATWKRSYRRGCSTTFQPTTPGSPATCASTRPTRAGRTDRRALNCQGSYGAFLHWAPKARAISARARSGPFPATAHTAHPVSPLLAPPQSLRAIAMQAVCAFCAELVLALCKPSQTRLLTGFPLKHNNLPCAQLCYACAHLCCRQRCASCPIPNLQPAAGSLHSW